MAKISFIIPAYNEQDRIVPTLLDCIEYCKKKNLDAEIIVVNDGSTDTTNYCVTHTSLEHPEQRIRLIDAAPHRGKGNALRVGILGSVGESLFLMDADGASSVETLDILLPHLDTNDIVIGVRTITLGTRKTVGTFFKKLYRLVFLPLILDSQSGYKLLRGNFARIAVAHTRMNRFGFDTEFLLIATRLGARIAQIEIPWNAQAGSKVRIVKDSLLTLWEFKKICANLLLGRYPKTEK